jgi:23S rRNA-/tRNA-specific pseudouridylate synthase
MIAEEEKEKDTDVCQQQLKKKVIRKYYAYVAMKKSKRKNKKKFQLIVSCEGIKDDNYVTLKDDTTLSQAVTKMRVLMGSEQHVEKPYKRFTRIIRCQRVHTKVTGVILLRDGVYLCKIGDIEGSAWELKL